LEIQLEQTRKPKTVTLNGVDGISNMTDLEYLQLKCQKYDNRMKCPICNVNDKEIILPCMHMYCNECIQKNLASR
jgi:late competence protein required for DNA uptake (superfamily II DNA/RNA helicase)